MPSRVNETMRYLVSDFDSRNPDPYAPWDDIEGGLYLNALSELPQSLRMLNEDSDLHVQIKEINGRPQVVKIVRKRDPLFNQGTEKYFLIDKEGTKISVSEEEYEAILGITRSSEDVYDNPEVELTGLSEETTGEEFLNPRDTWDLVYDATDFIRRAENLIKQVQAGWQPAIGLQEKINKMAEEFIYSADYFPYPADKRIKTPKAKKIEKLLKESDNLPTRREMFILFGRNPLKNELNQLTKKAYALPIGKKRSKLLKQAKQLKLQVYAKSKQVEVCQAEQKLLWNIWHDRMMKVYGKVKLTDWQFKRVVIKKYQRMAANQRITAQEASQYLSTLLKEDISENIFV